MAQITFNSEKNGIEIRFDSKPAAEVISSMKQNGFRYSARQNMWYAKQSVSTKAFADSVSDNATVSSATSVPSTPSTSKVADVFSLCFVNGIENNFELYHIYDTKEIASRIRKHLRERFRMIKWSVRCGGYNSIYLHIVSSPFAKHSAILKAIAHYAYKYAQSYNYDNSDMMSDYFDCNFYGCYENDIISYEYTQTDSTATSTAIEKSFDIAKAEYEAKIAEEENKRFAERMAKYEAEREEARKQEEIREQNVASVEETAEISGVSYFVDAKNPRINKMDKISEYADYVRENGIVMDSERVRVTREVHLDEEHYNFLANSLLSDYSFFEGIGGTSTDDSRIKNYSDYDKMSDEEQATVKWFSDDCVAVFCCDKLKFIANPEGFSYARYVYLT